MTLTQCYRLQKYRPIKTAGALRSEATQLQCKGEAWDSKRWGTGWHWRLHGYKQLANGQLKKRRPGAGQNSF